MSKKKPNVIVFFTDQQRWDTTGFHGNREGLTPNLDRMAANGTDVHRCFTSNPVCGPARATLQTGKYPASVGVHRNNLTLETNHPTLAQCFNEAGYHTGYIGKWHLVKSDDVASKGAVPEELRAGYKYWMAANVAEFVSDSYHAVLYDNDGKEHRPAGYRVDAYTDIAVDYIEAHKDEPFFLFMSFLEPHFQNNHDNYWAPDGYSRLYADAYVPPDLRSLHGNTFQNMGGYYGMVKRLDEAYGRVLDALKSLDLLEDTIVLFTTDHGCHFKTRNSEYKRSGHESSIRLPTVLCGGIFNRGRKIQELVSLTDLPPTLLEAAGLPVPEGMQGRSIVPLLYGDADDWADSVYVQISESCVGRAVRTKRWKYIVEAPETALQKDLAYSPTYTEKALYDLFADPYELCNIIELDSYHDVKAEMRKRLLAHAKRVGEPPIEEIVEVPERKAGQRKADIFGKFEL